ncbi:hypothetical protein [Treponema sp. OMZ 788]|uniref:hypothetical protein n=1 Tax=Treponema sp. OMZ 788 TaxID=2563664 RepID=UPI0020A4897C|nr:hypothetical protein [Treponema sp. OMZ 788]
MIKKYFVLFFVFTISLFSCSNYSKGDEERFIPLKEMKADYEYFWDFIDKGYPNKNTCIRNGADLKSIKTYYAEKLKTLKTEIDYMKFYGIICSGITDNHFFGHLGIVDYGSYKKYIETISLKEKRIAVFSLQKFQR